MKNAEAELANKSSKNTKLKDYLQLMKPSLSMMVVFSSVICFLLVPDIASRYTNPWLQAIWLFIGGMLVTGSANAINQVVEHKTDAIMKRTANRPVASGRMTVTEGWAFSIITGVIGIIILAYFFNLLSAGLAAFSLFLYAFVYTPLKRVNAIAVLVGAFPGALPCLIGWAAGENALSMGGWILFGIQFLWQFPHFWAIAWVAHSDYNSAGFKLLPSDKGPTKWTALQTIIYSLLLVPVCVLPYLVGLTGLTSLVIVTLTNFFLMIQCVRLYKENNAKAARRVMFSSYIHLPIVLLAYLSDKING